MGTKRVYTNGIDVQTCANSCTARGDCDAFTYTASTAQCTTYGKAGFTAILARSSRTDFTSTTSCIKTLACPVGYYLNSVSNCVLLPELQYGNEIVLSATSALYHGDPVAGKGCGQYGCRVALLSSPPLVNEPIFFAHGKTGTS